MKTYLPDKDHVKPLGRTCFVDNTLWMAFSGTGAAFEFRGNRAAVTLLADDSVSVADNRENWARVAVFVNGSRVVDAMMDEARKEFVIVDGGQVQEYHVEIVKLSETAMSTVGIREIAVDAEDGIHPAAEKAHFIEIVGDSITCGYGVDDEVAEHSFVTGTEDVTRAYAYRTAKALDVDYSLVSISGYGIISGYVDAGQPPKPEQTIPQYYEKLGFSYGRYLGRTPSEIPWDFRRQPELVVINLGTNDDSYTQDFPDRQEAYRAAYVDFLRQVRRRNPGAKILCVLGIMGDRLYPMVEKAVSDYRNETGDADIDSMKFDVQLETDGYVANWHPTAVTHGKAAEKLTRKIRELMGWR